MADRETAKTILSAGLKRRVLYPAVHHPRGLTASPVFKECSVKTAEHLLDIGQAPDAIIAYISAPEAWECERAQAGTAKAAIELAANVRQKHAQAMANTSIPTWPVLIGSPKQVAWAFSIRAKHAAKNPESKYLREKKNATWWIDNRMSL